MGWGGEAAENHVPRFGELESCGLMEQQESASYVHAMCIDKLENGVGGLGVVKLVKRLHQLGNPECREYRVLPSQKGGRQKGIQTQGEPTHQR